MRPLNFTNIKESAEGDFPRLEPGAYACSITAVEDLPDKEYLWVLFDIIQGERANYFADDFYRDKPYAHRMCFSYKDTAMSMLKGRLHVITDCNPGFDAEAALNAGKEQMLVGKAVGVVFGEEERYNSKTGEFELGQPRPVRLCRLDELDREKNANPKPKMLTDAKKREALVRAGEDPDAWFRRKELKQGGAATAAVADVFNEAIPF